MRRERAGAARGSENGTFSWGWIERVIASTRVLSVLIRFKSSSSSRMVFFFRLGSRTRRAGEEEGSAPVRASLSRRAGPASHVKRRWRRPRNSAQVKGTDYSFSRPQPSECSGAESRDDALGNEPDDTTTTYTVLLLLVPAGRLPVSPRHLRTAAASTSALSKANLISHHSEA